jgi:hypothetical protein
MVHAKPVQDESIEAVVMNQKDENKPAPPPAPRGLPVGYRQGLITAITVLLGFSLAFLRFWGFEAPGEWTPRTIAPTAALIVTVLLQVIALIRSLRLEDEEPNEYRKTVKWFTASVVVMLITVVIAAVVFSL